MKDILDNQKRFYEAQQAAAVLTLVVDLLGNCGTEESIPLSDKAINGLSDIIMRAERSIEDLLELFYEIEQKVIAAACESLRAKEGGEGKTDAESKKQGDGE
ncbi:MAG: hypothetical protein ABSG35_14420 [Syntrophobacteraceae bacterium]